MKIKDIYNPRQVYEGYFESYFIRPFFYEYLKFQGHESIGSCVKSFIAWVLITLGIVGIMLGQIGIIGPDGGVQAMQVVCWIWGLYSIVPLLALFSRTSQGAPSKPIKSKMLGIDTLLGVCCLLFFVLGLMMMETTMTKETLNPNAGATSDGDSTSFLDEVVEEEAIFSYEAVDAPGDAKNNNKEENKTNNKENKPAVVIDTMKDVTEPDLASPEESFDPTVEKPLELPNDSI